MKRLSRDLRGGNDSNDIPGQIEQVIAEGIRDDVIAGIASIQDKDGNYLGSDNPNASVKAMAAKIGYQVIWQGEQIAYLEFGTGAAGASGGYSGSAMAEAGYSPDPTKEMWYYPDNVIGDAVLSHGLMPQAPMLNASIAMRQVSTLMPAKLILEEALQLAVTV